MTFNFAHTKKLALAKKDKSNKQSIDEKILPLCSLLNESPNYFTTSSCSGRIILIKKKIKKSERLFIYRTHELITKDDLIEQLQNALHYDDIIFFKQEPALLVISCIDKEHQQKLFSLARNNGWKNSGILSLDKKLLIELKSTECLAFPIVMNKTILISDDFLKKIVVIANEHLTKSWKKIQQLQSLLKINGNLLGIT